MAEPGFPRVEGANPPGGYQQTILPKFPKDCMELKEFGPHWGGGGGARPKFYYVDPPLNSNSNGADALHTVSMHH